MGISNIIRPGSYFLYNYFRSYKRIKFQMLKRFCKNNVFVLINILLLIYVIGDQSESCLGAELLLRAHFA